ncbi:hypothetical protein [Streptomyces sulphureus]|uniref:hypothetical protein n=1 Tax=Streptomyces sulphureus TaxID=47758 RepID=UPI00035D0B43|nr:hypothetical protein [Streptomyces sulphureus]
MSKHKPNRSQDNRARAGAGMPSHPDDDELARLTESERVESGVDDYDPEEVPPATGDEERSPGEEAHAGLRDSQEYRDERAEVEVELKKGELDPDQLQSRRDRRPYPPTRYDD